jgi:DHA3 family macrolide efflux protein-like MFS transporter
MAEATLRGRRRRERAAIVGGMVITKNPEGSPYRPVLRHPVLRRVLPGIAISCLGDGMSAVAITWLALQLAPPDRREMWVTLAVVAYALPGAFGAVAFNRPLAGRPGAQVAGWDATLRAVALGAIPVAYVLGALTTWLFVLLLAVSSLLYSWGSAGRYAMVADLLPAEHHVAANSLVGTLSEAATVVGPPLAGLLVSLAGPASAIAVDAGTFAVLAVSYRSALAAQPATRGVPAPGVAAAVAEPSGFRRLLRDRRLSGLLALSAGFFFLYGPVQVALPLLVVDHWHAGAATLALAFAVFGAGSVFGGLLGGYLGRRPLWPIVVGIVAAWGAALVPVGLPIPRVAALASFALAGLIWAPFPATSTALFQRATPPGALSQVLAARGAVLVLAVPLGALCGGPLVATVGPAATLVACGLAILALGLAGAAVLAVRRRATRRAATGGDRTRGGPAGGDRAGADPADPTRRDGRPGGDPAGCDPAGCDPGGYPAVDGGGGDPDATGPAGTA